MGLRRYRGLLAIGAGLVTGVQAAIEADIPVGNLDQILGESMTTSDAQVEGLSANVVFVPSEIGRKMGELTVEEREARLQRVLVVVDERGDERNGCASPLGRRERGLERGDDLLACSSVNRGK